MPWVKGQSGNPNGRPPKNRALTAILERAGSKTVEVDGKRISGKRFMAQALFEIVTTGKTVLASGREVVAGPQAWLEIVKFLYAQIDRPPPKDINLGGQEDNPLTIAVVWDESGLEDTTSDAASGASGGESE